MSDEVITSGSFPVRLSQIGGAAKCGLCSPSKAMMRELWFSNSTDYKWIACHNAVKAHPHLTVHHLIRSTYVNIYLCQRPFQTSSACPSAILLTCTAQTFHQQSLLKIWLSFSQCPQFTNNSSPGGFCTLASWESTETNPSG